MFAGKFYFLVEIQMRYNAMLLPLNSTVNLLHVGLDEMTMFAAEISTCCCFCSKFISAK
jgi:hypothetical protein